MLKELGKQVGNNNGPPILTPNFLEKQRNKTRNMKIAPKRGSLDTTKLFLKNQ